jgi:hypothetical protein
VVGQDPRRPQGRPQGLRQALAAVGIGKPEPDTSRLLWRKVESNDPHVPPRAHLIMRAIAERITWKAEYDEPRPPSHNTHNQIN